MAMWSHTASFAVLLVQTLGLLQLAFADEVTVTVVTTNWANEQGWQILDGTTVVASGGVVNGAGTAFDSAATIVKTLELANDKEYTLKAFDSAYDGWYDSTIMVVNAKTSTKLAAGPGTKTDWHEKEVGKFTTAKSSAAPAGKTEPACPEDQAAVQVHLWSGGWGGEIKWTLNEHRSGKKIASGGDGQSYANWGYYIEKLCVSKAQGEEFVLNLEDKSLLNTGKGDGWQGGSIQVQTEDNKVLAWGPTLQKFTKETVGPFLLTTEAIQVATSYCTLQATGSGKGYSDNPATTLPSSLQGQLDGNYIPFMVYNGKPAYKRPATAGDPINGGGSAEVYLFYSHRYVDYWVLSRDMLSGSIYGSIKEPNAKTPVDFKVQWQGWENLGIQFACTGAAPSTDKTIPLQKAPNTDFVAAPAPQTPAVATTAADDSWKTATGTVWVDTATGGGKMSVQTATHPFGYKDCADLGCQASMSGNKVCNSECNHPECGFDGGDCCYETNASPTSVDTNPQICFDPAHSGKHGTFTFDYNVPKCRKAPRQQGSCGSCYAFAASTAMDNQRCKAHAGNDDDSWKSTAPKWIDSCVHPAHKQGYGNCQGGMVMWAMTTAIRWGYPLEQQCFPYSEAKMECSAVKTAYENAKTGGKCTSADDKSMKKSETPKADHVGSSMGWPLYPKSYKTFVEEFALTPGNFAKIKAMLVAQGSAPVHWNEWCTAKLSTVGKSNGADPQNPFADATCETEKGAHAVTMTGVYEYKKGEKTHMGYVLENSWGPGWGNRGRFYVSGDVDWSKMKLYVEFWKQEALAASDFMEGNVGAPKFPVINTNYHRHLQGVDNADEEPERPYWMRRAGVFSRHLLAQDAVDAPKAVIAEGDMVVPEIVMSRVEPDGATGVLASVDCDLAKYQDVLNKYLAELKKHMDENPGAMGEMLGVELDMKLNSVSVELPYACQQNVQDGASVGQKFIVKAAIDFDATRAGTTKNFAWERTFVVTGNLQGMSLKMGEADLDYAAGQIADFAFEVADDPNLKEDDSLAEAFGFVKDAIDGLLNKDGGAPADADRGTPSASPSDSGAATASLSAAALFGVAALFAAM